MRVAWALAVVIGVGWCLAAAAEEQRGMGAYLEGLDRLEHGKFSEAAEAFSNALDADEDNGRFLLARGVARVFAEKFAEADRDLLRAAKLEPQNEEVRMWRATVAAMRGDFDKAPGIYPEYTKNEEFNAVRVMSREYGWITFLSRNLDGTDPDVVRKAKADHERARGKFGELAAAFASRAKGGTAGVGPLLVTRAKQRVEAKDYAGALADAERALAGDEGNAEALLYAAECNAHLGAPALARRQFTAVLTQQPENGRAWAGRAVVAAMMGDGARAEADLAVAREIDPAGAARAAEEIKGVPAFTGDVPKREELASAVEALQKQVKAGMSGRNLAQAAAGIVRGANVQRLYADETYVDRRRALVGPTKRVPPSAAALADLGEFLYREATNVRGEAVEPRAEFQTYRPQGPDAQAREIAQAEAALDSAIALDPNNVKALTFKGACLAWRLQWDQAEAVLRRALKVDAAYAPLLDVFSQLLDHAASVKSAAASNLRATRSWRTLDYIYWQYPSQAELQQASAYEDQARRLWALAEEHLRAAARLHAGKRDGFYYEGVLALREGDVKAARAAFERCVEVSTRDVQALDQLAGVYGKLGMTREAFEAQARATNLSHTTAGPMLRFAWTQIGRTAWGAAKQACRAAVALDPADARGPAYLGAIAEADGRTEEAAAWYRVALAIERARGLMSASALDPKATGTLSPEDCGFLIALEARLGRMAVEAKQYDEALAVLGQCVAMTDRVDRIARFSPTATAQLPSGQVEDPMKGPAMPEAPTVFDLAAWARLGYADALAGLGKTDEAIAAYWRNVDLEKQKPPTIDPGNGYREPEAWSVMRLTKLLLAKGDRAGAFELVNRGLPWQLTPEANEEWRRISDEVRQAKMKQEAGAEEEEWRKYREQQMEQVRKRQQQMKDEAERRRRQQQGQ